MRGIKFRYLWEKKWYYIDFQKDNLAIKFKEFEERTKTTQLIQFIGLKDKNEKEIYEEDIVNIKHPRDISGDFTNTNGRVFWYEEEDSWYHGNSNGRPPKKMWEYCEVIGNIYENPELIK